MGKGTKKGRNEQISLAEMESALENTAKAS